MSFINFLRSRYFWISVLVASLLLFAGVKITLSSLKGFTNHGESITVPDLNNLTVTEVEETLKTLKLKYAINDSNYFPGKNPNTVFYHEPEPESKVKEGRTIYLSIYSRVPTPVKMPNVEELDSSLAVQALLKAGLRVGRITYRPAEGRKKVIDQLFDGRTVLPGKDLPKGSRIELVLADGIGERTGPVPNLVGQTLDGAKWVLIANEFNIGFVSFDETVQDSSTAVVYKQIPAEPEELNYGQTVDIFLTKELPPYLQNSVAPPDKQ